MRIIAAHTALWSLSASLVSIALAQPALAQDAQQPAVEGEEQAQTGLQDIIVTATKVATAVQDTPLAITAVTSETLQQRGLTSTADLGNIVPNATFRKAEGVFGPAVTVYLRGIGQGDPQFSGEPAVSFYIDDVYYPFLFGAQFDLIDLDHVEVLRGPQGTLFGRNSIAGAVNMVSKTPSLTRSSGFVDITVGSYSRRDIRAGVSVPLTDTLAIGASGVYKKRNGYQKLLDFSCQMYANGTPQLAGSFPFQSPETSWSGGAQPNDCTLDYFGGEDQLAVRGSLYWKPTDSVTLNISADYADMRDDNPAEYVFEYDYNVTTRRPNFVTAANQFSIPGTPFLMDNRFETGDPFKTYDNMCDPFAPGTRIAGNTYYNGSRFRGGNCYGRDTLVKNRGIQGKLVVGLTDEIDFSAILGYREMNMMFGAASDGTVLADSIIYHSYDEHHVTGEARLTGRFSFADIVTGLFYYDGSALHLGNPQGVQAGTQRVQTDTYAPHSWAGYANAVTHVTDRLNITAGLRYSDDSKFIDFNSVTDVTPPGQSNFVGGNPATVFQVNIGRKKWDWKGGLDYKLNDDTLVYVSAGSGYRLPSFNVRPSQPGQNDQVPGDELISYELGAKAEFFDRRLKINAAAFFMTFTQRAGGYAGQEGQLTGALGSALVGPASQANWQTVIPGGPVGTDLASSFTTCRPYVPSDGPQNLSTTPDKGVGVACVARTYSYAIAEGDIRGFEAEVEAEPIDNLNFTGSVGYTTFNSDSITRQTTVPHWTASGGVQYRAEIQELGGSLTPRLDWYYVGKTAFNGNLPQYDEPAYSVFNGRISYRNDEHDFEIALGGTNLLNKFYYRNKFLRTPSGSGQNLGQPGAPREFYLSMKKSF